MLMMALYAMSKSGSASGAAAAPVAVALVIEGGGGALPTWSMALTMARCTLTFSLSLKHSPFALTTHSLSHGCILSADVDHQGEAVVIDEGDEEGR